MLRFADIDIVFSRSTFVVNFGVGVQYFEPLRRMMMDASTTHNLTVLSESFPTFGKFATDDVIAIFYQQAQQRWFGTVNDIFFL
jgi:hypothetical protein